MAAESPLDRFEFSKERPRALLQKLRLDAPLLTGLLLLCGIGTLILYSAGDANLKLLLRHGVRLGLAFCVMFLLAQVNPHQLRRFAPLLYVAGVLLLIAVLILGVVEKGAQRWLDLHFFRFQPSEILKIATPMMVAWYLARHRAPPDWRQLLLSGFLIAVPTLLIAKQPDLGTAFLVASSGLAVVFLAGISWRLLFGLAGLGAALMPVLWHFMHDYQRDRVRTFFDPESDPLGRGYHIIQSKIAIGSGGLYGKGWLQGTQSHLDFLPEPSTDFIFAVFAEEFGLTGCLTLLSVYLFIISRCLYMAIQARDSFSRLLAGGLALTFFVYVFVNIGMVIGVLPVVGVPLPMISYGGTSMVTLIASFGIIMSIYGHRVTAV